MSRLPDDLDYQSYAENLYQKNHCSRCRVILRDKEGKYEDVYFYEVHMVLLKSILASFYYIAILIFI